MLDEKPGQEALTQQETIPSPLERCHVGTGETLAPYNEDLAWIVRQFKERTGACAVTVSIHHFDGRAPAIEVADSDEASSQRALESWASRSVEQLPAYSGRNWPRTQWRSPSDEFPYHSLTMHMASNDCSRAAISAFFSNKLNQDEIEAREFVSLRFQPVLSGYFKLWLLHQATSRRLQTVESALAKVDFGVIAVDRDAKIVFENPAATKLLDSGKVVQRSRGSVCASGPVENVKLRLAIDQVLSGEVDDRGGCETLVVIGTSARAASHLIAAVVPVDHAQFQGNDSAAIVYIFDPGTPNDQTLAPLAKWYGLSPAEARLVKLLVAGRSVAEMADREAIKQDTVRTYLKNIFRKTGTRSQTDLVRLMMTSPVRLRAREKRIKGLS